MARRATVAASAGLLCARAHGQDPDKSIIRPGVAWTDTSGNRVYAGGANLLLDGGKYWLVGEGKKVCVQKRLRARRASAPCTCMLPHAMDATAAEPRFSCHVL